MRPSELARVAMKRQYQHGINRYALWAADDLTAGYERIDAEVYELSKCNVLVRSSEARSWLRSGHALEAALHAEDDLVASCARPLYRADSIRTVALF